MSKQRSRRLRKKLHVDEFRELGFDVDIELRENLDEAQAERFFHALVDELILPADLVYGGATAGFVCRASAGSVTEAEREMVRAWIEAREEVAEVRVGELIDAWYAGACA